MRLRPLSREVIRSLDACAAIEYHLPTVVLMENAGRGAAALLRGKLAPGDQIVVACGPGNNGGDGAVLARYLDAWGYTVRVIWFADPARLRGDAEIQKQILDASDIPLSIYAKSVDLPLVWNEASWIVDALIGTGLTRPVEGVLYDAITSINQSGRPVLALDLPSGLDSDSGKPLGTAIRATFTITFVAPKLGFSAPGAEAYTGPVEVIEIGIPRKLIRQIYNDSGS